MTALSERIDALNGWQRLWIVYSLLAAICVVSIAWTMWPAQVEEVSWDDLPPDMQSYFGDPSIEAARPSAEEVIEFRARLDLETAQRSARRRDLVRAAFVWWLGIVVSTYALGWSIGWIRNGFRRKA
jgi:hypothetical protein